MSGRIVLVNGRAVDLDEPAILATDRGFTLGDGVFESLRAYSGRPFLLERHIERLASGAATLGIPLPFPLADIAAEVAEALALNALDSGDAYLRITLSRGPSERGLRPPPEPHPTLTILASPLDRPPAPAIRGGRTAIVATSVRRNEKSAACRLKTLAQVENILASNEAAVKGANEAILVNHESRLAEGTTANLAWVSGGRLLTPSLDCGILPGITRAVVIELAAETRTPVEEGRFPVSSLHGAEEAFLTSSLIEIEPLVRLDGKAIGAGKPGPVTLALAEVFRNLIGSRSAT